MGASWTDILGAVSAGLSTLAAGGAYLAARRANATADSVAAIERARWHADLTPRFSIDFRDGLGQAKVHLNLDGPDHLGHLDEVTLTVEDDDKDRTSNFTPGRGLTLEQIKTHVWGPFRFVQRINDGDENGRSVGPFAMDVGKGHPLAMERTRPGSWMTQDQAAWQQEYVGQSIRLRIDCKRGDEQWTVTQRVDNPPWRATAS